MCIVYHTEWVHLNDETTEISRNCLYQVLIKLYVKFKCIYSAAMPPLESWMIQPESR